MTFIFISDPRTGNQKEVITNSSGILYHHVTRNAHRNTKNCRIYFSKCDSPSLFHLCLLSRAAVLVFVAVMLSVIVAAAIVAMVSIVIVVAAVNIRIVIQIA